MKRYQVWIREDGFGQTNQVYADNLSKEQAEKIKACKSRACPTVWVKEIK